MANVPSQGALQGADPFFLGSVTLLIMGCISLVTAILFYRRARLLMKMPQNLTVSIYDKTFNVFDPFPEQKKVFHKNILLVPVAIAYSTFVLATYALTKLIQMGAILSLLILIVCAALMIIDETFEVYKNVGVFAKAFKDEAELATGDIVAFTFARRSVPRLFRYYLSLGIIFLCLGVTLSYVFPLAFSFSLTSLGTFSQILLNASSSLGVFAPLLLIFIGAAFFAAFFILAIVIVRKVRRKIFDVPIQNS